MNDLEEFEKEGHHSRYEQQKISVVRSRKMTAFTLLFSTMVTGLIGTYVIMAAALTASTGALLAFGLILMAITFVVHIVGLYFLEKIKEVQ